MDLRSRLSSIHLSPPSVTNIFPQQELDDYDDVDDEEFWAEQKTILMNATRLIIPLLFRMIGSLCATSCICLNLHLAFSLVGRCCG